MIAEQRALSHGVGDEHPFDGFKLEKLGTHSFKYTAVSLMKDVSGSTALVGAVAIGSMIQPPFPGSSACGTGISEPSQ